MHTHPTDSRQRVWQMGIGLLLTSCCLWGVVLSLFPWGTWSANRVERVRGNVELLAPAQWSLTGLVSLSPDGRFMALHRTINNQREMIIKNLVTHEITIAIPQITEMRWLDTHHGVMFTPNRNCYYTVYPQQMVTKPIHVIARDDYFHEQGWATIQSYLDTAQHAYVMETFGDGAGYKAVLEHTDHSWSLFYLGYGTELGMTRTQLETYLQTVPFIQIPRQARPTVTLTNDQLPSPHQPWYVTREVWNVNERVAIYSTEDRLLAEAYKPGWDPYVLGWSHDGTSVYIQFRRSGAAAAVLQPAMPVYKLSPLTPMEAFWQLIWRSSLVVMVLVGLSDPFIQQRRHKRETSD